MSRIGSVIRLFDRGYVVVVLTGALCWLVGQYFRDRFWVTALAFYIPSPVLVVGLVIAFVRAWCWGRRSVALVCALSAVFPLLVIVFAENRWLRTEPVLSTKSSMRIVHWNVCRGALGWKGILRLLQEQRADVYVLSEVPPQTNAQSLATDFGPEYDVVCTGGMAIVGRGHLVQGSWVVKRPVLQVYSIWGEYQQETLQIFAVDVVSNVWNPRHPLLRELVACLAERQPDIAVGDLNSPRRSTMLAALPSGYQHAYDMAGRGWSYTWPVPVPVLALDQCIVGHRVQPMRYYIRTTGRSDHRMQVLDFAIP